jgi:hypothetical protein
VALEAVKDPEWKEAYAVIGEVVLLATALDHQLNHVAIEVLHLIKSPLLEPVVATLDCSRKIEIVRGRIKHIPKQEWRKIVESYVGAIERILKVRNLVCHAPLVKTDDGFKFAPWAANKIWKSLDVENPKRVRGASWREVVEGISLAERTLAEGEVVLVNFKRVNAKWQARKDARRDD